MTDEGLAREWLNRDHTDRYGDEKEMAADLAALLAHVRLNEAKWWCHVFNNNEPYKWAAIGDERIAALEAAAKEQAAGGSAAGSEK